MHNHKWVLIGVLLLMSLLWSSTSQGAMIHWWRFDDASGTTAWDAVAKTTTALLCSLTTCPDATGPAWNTTGRYQGSLTFDGTNDNVNATDLTDVEGISQLSVAIWVNATNLTTNFKTPIGKRDSDAFRWYMATSGTVAGNDDVLIGMSNSQNSFVNTTSNLLVAGVWQHWVMTFDGTDVTVTNRLKFHLNGVLQTVTGGSTLPPTTANITAPLRIGASAADYWIGLLDDVRIYNHMLTAGEIMSLYTRGRAAR